MEIERIVKRIYERCKKTHRGKLLPETILEVLDNSEIIFESDERLTKIFKEIIKTENISNIYATLGRKYNLKPQRICQLEHEMIEKMFLADAKKRIKNLKPEEIEESSIEILGFNNKIMGVFEELHCKKIKDLLDIDEEYLKVRCMRVNVDYKTITNRLKLFNIKPINNRKIYIKPIEELNMPPQTYRFLKKNNIKTNQDIVVKIDELISIAPDGKYKIKEQVERLYNEIAEEFDIHAEENTYVSELKRLRNEQQEKIHRIETMKSQLYNEIDKYMNYLEKYGHNSAYQKHIQFLLESIDKSSNKILETEKQISEISDEILKTVTSPSKTRK